MAAAAAAGAEAASIAGSLGAGPGLASMNTLVANDLSRSQVAKEEIDIVLSRDLATLPEVLS